jgi:hypothetical protein
VRDGCRVNPASVGDRRRTFPFPPRLERLALAFFLLQAWHGTVIAAEAASPEEQAAQHLQAGNERLEAEDFAGALAEYRAGFALFPRANLLFNIGLAEVGLDHPLDASEAFEGVLTRPETTPEVAAQAREELDKLQEKLSLLAVSGGEGAGFAVDGKNRGTLPLKGPVRLLPGPHLARAVKDGHQPFERQFTGAPGERLDLVVTLEPLPPPARPHRRYWLWGTIGAAVATAAVISVIALQNNAPKCTAEVPCLYFPPKE